MDYTRSITPTTIIIGRHRHAIGGGARSRIAQHLHQAYHQTFSLACHSANFGIVRFRNQCADYHALRLVCRRIRSFGVRFGAGIQHDTHGSNLDSQQGFLIPFTFCNLAPCGKSYQPNRAILLITNCRHLVSTSAIFAIFAAHFI